MFIDEKIIMKSFFLEDVGLLEIVLKFLSIFKIKDKSMIWRKIKWRKVEDEWSSWNLLFESNNKFLDEFRSGLN